MSDLFVVRFPSGETEYRMSERAPNVGDTLKRDGDNWTVEDMTEGEDGTAVVTLRPQPRLENEFDGDA
jgi:hypothetical protein